MILVAAPELGYSTWSLPLVGFQFDAVGGRVAPAGPGLSFRQARPASCLGLNVYQAFYLPAVNAVGYHKRDPVFLLRPADQVAPAAPLLFVLTFRRPSELYALGAGPSQPSLSPLNDQRFLEFRNRGQHTQEELPIRCGVLIGWVAAMKPTPCCSR